MSKTDEDSGDILGVECRFVVYCPPPKPGEPDLHFVKELIHKKDGSKETNIRLVRNFKRKFWVTKKGYRNHQQKKEVELIDRVDEFESTQAELNRNIARALGMPGFSGDPRKLSASPYLYGTDILSTALVKNRYQTRYNLFSPFKTAVLDLEWDVVEGHGEITVGTISFGNKMVTVISKKFVAGIADVKNRLIEKMQRYIGDYLTSRNIEVFIEIADTEISLIEKMFEYAHKWRPDFLAIWNIDADIPKIIAACQKAGVDPKWIFSDPAVPDAYKHFFYKIGQRQKRTDSGKLSPIKWYDQWHTVITPASFYVIDAACVYRQIRRANGEEPSYSLDYIMQKELRDKEGKPTVKKLKIVEADGLYGIDYHIFMQTQHKLEYIVYNQFDCIGVELLDEKTLDLAIAFPSQCESSDFGKFNSQPRRVVDDLHFYVQNLGYVYGSTASEMKSDLDQLTLGVKDWIVTLPAHTVVDNGLRVIAEHPELRTNIRAHVGDLDVSASYPNGGAVFNTSKATTFRELCKIQGVTEYTQRMQGINYTTNTWGNAVEYCQAMLKMPTFDQMLESFVRETNMVEDTRLSAEISNADTTL